jgi:hypothetical protein
MNERNMESERARYATVLIGVLVRRFEHDGTFVDGLADKIEGLLWPELLARERWIVQCPTCRY